jgi:hypothetical protein
MAEHRRCQSDYTGRRGRLRFVGHGPWTGLLTSTFARLQHLTPPNEPHRPPGLWNSTPPRAPPPDATAETNHRSASTTALASKPMRVYESSRPTLGCVPHTHDGSPHRSKHSLPPTGPTPPKRLS